MNPEYKKFLRTHGALLIVNLIYGANFTIAKQVMPRFVLPYGFIVLRVTTAIFFYSIVQFFFLKNKVNLREDWKRFALCGFFGIAFNQLMFFKGLSLTTPINGALLMIVTPIFVIIFSAFIYKNSVGKIQILGTLLGALGAFLLIGGFNFSFSSATATGDMLIVINAMSYAVYLVIAKPLMEKYHPFTAITYIFLFGYIWVLIAGLGDLQSVEWSAIPVNYYWHFAFILIMATAVVYFLNLYAMRETSSAVVGNYIYTQPIFAVVIALFTKNDTLTAAKIIAGCMIALGVYLVSKKKHNT